MDNSSLIFYAGILICYQAPSFEMHADILRVLKVFDEIVISEVCF